MWEAWLDVQSPTHAVRKVKAHAEAEVLGGDISVRDYLQNALADAAADAYADVIMAADKADTGHAVKKFAKHMQSPHRGGLAPSKPPCFFRGFVPWTPRPHFR